jgi:hypothetical protein
MIRIFDASSNQMTSKMRTALRDSYDDSPFSLVTSTVSFASDMLRSQQARRSNGTISVDIP